MGHYLIQNYNSRSNIWKIYRKISNKMYTSKLIFQQINRFLSDSGMNVYFSQTITMVHEVKNNKTIFRCTKQGQIRKSREIYTNQHTISLTNIDRFFNKSISMLFIRCPNL